MLLITQPSLQLPTHEPFRKSYPNHGTNVTAAKHLTLNSKSYSLVGKENWQPTISCLDTQFPAVTFLRVLLLIWTSAPNIFKPLPLLVSTWWVLGEGVGTMVEVISHLHNNNIQLLDTKWNHMRAKHHFPSHSSPPWTPFSRSRLCLAGSASSCGPSAFLFSLGYGFGLIHVHDGGVAAGNAGNASEEAWLDEQVSRLCWALSTIPGLDREVCSTSNQKVWAGIVEIWGSELICHALLLPRPTCPTCSLPPTAPSPASNHNSGFCVPH